MRKIHLFILALATLVSCSNDELTDVSNQVNEDLTTRSAADKIFSVQQITTNTFETAYTQNYLCTDGDGNLYFFDNSYSSDVTIKKYDPSTDETSLVVTIPNYGTTDVRSICIDNQKNIYYTNGQVLLKILADNKGIVDLSSKLPLEFDYHVIYGLCAADNGNVFVSMENDLYIPEIDGWKQQQTLFRISANGNVSEILNNIGEDNFYLKGGGIVKPKGAFVYAVQGFGSANKYVKAGTTNGTYEGFTTRNDVQSITAALAKANPYALSGYDIIQLRPNAASDLVIGTIPNFISNGQGTFLELAKPTYFCANADATIFYVVAAAKNSYTSNLYKVTLN